MWPSSLLIVYLLVRFLHELVRDLFVCADAEFGELLAHEDGEVSEALVVALGGVALQHFLRGLLGGRSSGAPTAVIAFAIFAVVTVVQCSGGSCGCGGSSSDLLLARHRRLFASCRRIGALGCASGRHGFAFRSWHCGCGCR